LSKIIKTHVVSGLIGKKIGMTSIFTEDGRNVPCTVIEVQPNVVVQVKSEDSDGYSAVQLGFGEAKEKNTSNALKGHFAKAGTSPKKVLREFRDYELQKAVGDVVKMDEVLEEGDLVNVAGTSKGKGFQGVVKRHNFRGVGDQTHGQHNRGRAPGSIGAASYPARVFKGMRMAGRTGGNRVKMQNLEVVKMLPERDLVLIKGAVPGHKGGIVIIEK